MIYLAGTIISFFLAFILLGKRNKNTPDKILFLWLNAIGVHLFLFYLAYTQLDRKYPHVLGLITPIPLLHGPFLFLYTSALTNQLKKRSNAILHFIPILAMAFLLSKFYLLPGELKLLVFKNKGEGYTDLLRFNSFLIKLSGVLYIIWSLKLLKRHKKTISDQFTNTEHINLHWLKYLILGVAIVWCFVLINNSYLTFFSAIIFVISIGYFGINQVGIFTPKYSLTDSITTVSETTSSANKASDVTILSKKQPNSKYEKSGLNHNNAEEIHKRLKQKMEGEELFANADLTLLELAQKLNVHQNHLSQVINTFEEKNFYDYVNELRIKKFISVVKKPENRQYTLLALAYECGFNSKSAFNKHFKKVTNQTPSQFINSV